MKKFFIAMAIFCILAAGIVFAPITVQYTPGGTAGPATVPSSSNIEIYSKTTKIEPKNNVYIIPEDNGKTPSEFTLQVKNLKTEDFWVGINTGKTNLVGKYYDQDASGSLNPDQIIPRYGARTAKDKIDLQEKFTTPYSEECKKNAANSFDCTLTFSKLDGTEFSDLQMGKKISLAVLIDNPKDNLVQDAEIKELTVQLGPTTGVVCNSITECFVEIDKLFIGIFQ